MKIFSRFPVPKKIKQLDLNGEVIISDLCEELWEKPHRIKILLLTPKGFVEAGKCRADFYARDMEDVYLWLRLLSLSQP